MWGAAIIDIHVFGVHVVTVLTSGSSQCVCVMELVCFCSYQATITGALDFELMSQTVKLRRAAFTDYRIGRIDG